jgi:plasmid rolling circle replication initiator protein Rep
MKILTPTIEKHNTYNDSFNASEKWPIKKIAASKMAARLSMLGGQYKRRAERMASCSHFLQTSSCPDGHMHKIIRANLCKDRACPVCAWRRSMRLAVRTAEAMAKAGGRYLLLTLTIPNPPLGELRESLQLLTKSFGRMMKHSRLRGIVGGHVRTLEITANLDDSTWHPHIHALLRVEESYFRSALYLHQSDWLDLWRSVSRIPETTQVDIRPADQDSYKEVAKYTTKDADLQSLPLPWFSEWLEAVKGLRLWSSGGCLKINQNEIEEIEVVDELKASESDICPVCGSHLQTVDWEFSFNESIYKPSLSPVMWPKLNQHRKRE